jgi:hypothetical protein
MDVEGVKIRKQVKFLVKQTVYKDFMEENQPQKVNSKSINAIWAFEMILYLQVGFEFIYDIRALKWKIRQLSVHFGVLRSKHGHHNLLFYCVTVEKYTLQKKQLRLPVFKI